MFLILEQFCQPRLQRLMDHTYRFYETTREEIESELKNNFSNFKRVEGIYGLDVTEEIYSKDQFLMSNVERNLRYLVLNGEYIYSACIVITTDDCKILCDPWFTQGALEDLVLSI